MISIIVAHTRDFVIGKDGGMPWHLPKDLAFFKKTTVGSTVIMGRKTFESIGRALPNRKNIVITSNDSFVVPDGVIKCSSLEDAIKMVGNDNAFILGGGTIYQHAIKFVDRLYITYVDANIEGDTYFPKYDENDFRLISSFIDKKDEKNQYDLIFKIYERKTN